MIIYNWNVNGIRACIKKGFFDWLKETSPDILCLQETKINPGQLTKELQNVDGYEIIWNSAQRRGYSGVATFYKNNIISQKSGFGIDKYDVEGRVIEVELDKFILFNVYFPNGQKDEERLNYKLDFYKDFLDYTLQRKKEKNKDIIIVGDFNTAHTEIDLRNPKANEKYSGFMPIERKWIDKYIEAGYTDIFRNFNPGKPDQYTWWSYRFNARLKDIGWRIDYFMITDGLIDKVKKVLIHKDVMGSDHCPISLELVF